MGEFGKLPFGLFMVSRDTHRLRFDLMVQHLALALRRLGEAPALQERLIEKIPHQSDPTRHSMSLQGRSLSASLSKRQKWAEVAVQKYLVEDKGGGELMRVRSWMKAVPENVIIRVGHRVGRA